MFMNLIVLPLSALLGLSVFSSYFGDSLAKNTKPGNWRKEFAQEWDAARNMRPCVGAHDPACRFHDADKVK